MLYRAGIAAIVLFWAAMWALLIRSELGPQEQSWRAVPVELVLEKLFQQGQDSQLSIRNGTAELGRLHLTPKTNDATGERTLELSGNLRLDPPGAGTQHQRAFWSSTLQLERDLKIRQARAEISLRNAAAVFSSLVITLDPRAGTAHYTLQVEDEAPVEQSFALNEAGLREVLRRWEVDPAWLRYLPSPSGAGTAATPSLTARQAQLAIRQEQVETYLLTLRHQGQTLLEVHLSQLGQILQAKTILGWDLVAE